MADVNSTYVDYLEELTANGIVKDALGPYSEKAANAVKMGMHRAGALFTTRSGSGITVSRQVSHKGENGETLYCVVVEITDRDPLRDRIAELKSARGIEAPSKELLVEHTTFQVTKKSPVTEDVKRLLKNMRFQDGISYAEMSDFFVGDAELLKAVHTYVNNVYPGWE